MTSSSAFSGLLAGIACPSNSNKSLMATVIDCIRREGCLYEDAAAMFFCGLFFCGRATDDGPDAGGTPFKSQSWNQGCLTGEALRHPPAAGTLRAPEPDAVRSG